MLFSRALIPTVKEAPADATNASHVLLSRAGYIRRVGAGIYDYLPLGYRVLRKVEGIVRQEMDRAGALEILMPALLPAEYFKETGRWDLYGPTLFRIKDRKGGDYHLGPDARGDRDGHRPPRDPQLARASEEPLPGAGEVPRRAAAARRPLARARVRDEGRATRSTPTRRARRRATRRCARPTCASSTAWACTYRMVQADSGAIGGSTSAEFQVLVDSGEDAIVACDKCDYAANVEVATVKAAHDAGGTRQPEPAEQGAHAGARHHRRGDRVPRRRAGPDAQVAPLRRRDGPKVVMAVVRGDHDVNEVRLARALARRRGVPRQRGGRRAKATGAKVGFAGPVGFKGRILVDRAASPSCRAAWRAPTRPDYHLKNVRFGRDYEGEVADLRLAATGDPCPSCAAASSRRTAASRPGTSSSSARSTPQAMGATLHRREAAAAAARHGLLRHRRLAPRGDDDRAAPRRQRHALADERRALPRAPRDLGKEERRDRRRRALTTASRRTGSRCCGTTATSGPGVKFKDADLIGIPLRVTIGAKGLAGGNVELKPRTRARSQEGRARPRRRRRDGCSPSGCRAALTSER